MRLLLPVLLAVAVLGCRNIDGKVKPTDMCDRQCFVGDPAQAGVGACNMGTYGCTPETEAVCTGSGGPSQEVCDGIDNDCNGKIDELSYCCKIPFPEICDGKDNDCDGDVDEESDFDEVFCYNGEKGTSSKGTCHAGTLKCVAAKWKCVGEKLPENEICDGLDNDCDGSADEDLHRTDPVDVVTILDTSGSMGDKIDSVKYASIAFGTQYQSDLSVHWALVTAPDMDSGTWMWEPHLFLNFTTAVKFSDAMMLQKPTGSGNEPTLDALEQVCNPINELGLAWTPGARKVVILFSDEPPDSFTVPKNTVSDVSLKCIGAGVSVNLFVPLSPSLDWQWKNLAQGTRGRVFDIMSPYMAENLKTLIPTLLCR